jgi:DNA-binding response OmpR family regulator
MNAVQKALLEERKFILVVDDDGDMNTVVTDILSEAGYDVVSAYNWRSAIRTIQELRPDLVILDVMLPDANGVEKCREIMRDAKTKDIPVIMMSGLSEQPIRESSLLAGAKQFIHKPDLYRDLLKEAEKIFTKSGMNNSLLNDILHFERDTAGYLREFISNTTN